MPSAIVSTPPDPPLGGDIKVRDNDRFTILSIFIASDNLSSYLPAYFTFALKSICICFKLDLSLQGQFIV